MLARSIQRQGRVDEAEPLAREAVDSAGQNLQTAMRAQAILAEVRSLQGHHDEARELVDGAIAIAERTDDVIDHALVLLAGSRVAEAASETERATRFAVSAAALLGDKGVALTDTTIARRAPETGGLDTGNLDTDDLDTDALDTGALDTDEAEFDELGEGRTTPLANRATRLMLRGVEALERGDRDAARDVMADDFVLELRLRIATEQRVDRDQFLDILAALIDQGFPLALDPIAVRGDHLALFRNRMVADEGTTERILFVEAGTRSVTRMVSYDPDLLEEAMAELERRDAGRRPTIR